jgi:hypothetical protein
MIRPSRSKRNSSEVPSASGLPSLYLPLNLKWLKSRKLCNQIMKKKSSSLSLLTTIKRSSFKGKLLGRTKRFRS